MGCSQDPCVRPLISFGQTIILRAPLPSPTLPPLALSLSPFLETEYISRSATSTDARQDKWPRDGGYITFQNWPNRRLSGDEKEAPRYIEPRGHIPASTDAARCIVFPALLHRNVLFKDSSSARFPNRRTIPESGFLLLFFFLIRTERARDNALPHDGGGEGGDTVRGYRRIFRALTKAMQSSRARASHVRRSIFLPRDNPVLSTFRERFSRRKNFPCNLCLGSSNERLQLGIPLLPRVFYPRVL